MDHKVFIEPCDDYANAELAMQRLILDNHLIDNITEGMKVGIKVNLVAAMKPDTAVPTNYNLVKALCKMLVDKGAIVTIGDSPGGLFNEGTLKSCYKQSKMDECLMDGVSLNNDFSTSIHDLNAFVVKKLDVSNWLLHQDVIINFCKLKSHGMLGLSNATKNMFGSVPGILKPEYHYRYQDHNDFADMLIDIQNFYHPVLHIMDAVVAMEGNGPTQGAPRHVGLVAASSNCYDLDVVACKLINLDIESVRTVTRSIVHGYTTGKLEDIELNKSIEEYIVPDFLKIKPNKDMGFHFGKTNLINKVVGGILRVKPRVVKKECVGCQKCANICPAKAITMVDNKPTINRSKCIRCFCCQEFCPTGAMKAHKKWIVRILTKEK